MRDLTRSRLAEVADSTPLAMAVDAAVSPRRPGSGRLLRTFAVLAWVLLPVLSLSAQEEPPEDLESDVLEWVDQLDGPSLAQRKAAEKALIEAGPAALPFLPESKVGVSIEAAERLTRVRKALMAMRTKKETRSVAISVDLSQVTTLGEALEAISRDSGIEFEHEAVDSTAISAVSTPLSFWHAVDLVLDQAQLDINFYGGDRSTLQLTSRNPERPSRVDSAAYTGV